MRARSTVLHGRVLGGRSPPSEIARMIWSIACAIYHMGSSEVVWGSREDLLGAGRDWGVPGKFWTGPGIPLEKVIFSFLRGELVNGVMKHLLFSFGPFCEALGGHWIIAFLLFF